MVNHRRHIAFTGIFGMALLAMMGCSRSPEPSPYPPPLTKEQAAQRTVAPLTRPIALDKAGVIADVQFDLPPPGPSSSRQLMLGLRLNNPDSRALRELIRKVSPSELSAKVRLQRLNNGEAREVPLSYVPDNAAGWSAVPAEGSVAGAVSSGVDDSSLRTVGLMQDGTLYAFFYFAHLPDAGSGRYRLKLELQNPRPDLNGVQAELVVAYSYKAK